MKHIFDAEHAAAMGIKELRADTNFKGHKFRIKYDVGTGKFSMSWGVRQSEGTKFGVGDFDKKLLKEFIDAGLIPPEIVIYGRTISLEKTLLA